MKKSVVITIVILTVVAVVLVYRQSKNSQIGGYSSASSLTFINPGNTDGFPADIPLESGVTYNSNSSVLPDGSAQVSRTFKSSKTLDENFQIYFQFFSGNGWQLITSSQPNFIAARKDKMFVQVNIGNTVSIHITIEKK